MPYTIRRRVLDSAALALVLGAISVAPVRAQGDTAALTKAHETFKADFLDKYCVDCHNIEDWAGGVAFDILDLKNLPQDIKTWEDSVRKVRAGLMPPAGKPRPSPAVMKKFRTELEGWLDQAALQHPNPGYVPASRLNRTEYANAIRDLLALDIDVETRLPADDAVDGFDNIADVLSVSPTLVEAYVSAAMQISRQAVGDREMVPTQVHYAAPPGLDQEEHVEGLPLGTHGGMLITHNFPLDGEYEFKVATGGPGILSGQVFGPLPRLTVYIDGEPVQQVDDPSEFRIKVKAGPREIALALADRTRWVGVNEFYDHYTSFGSVRSLEIKGPFSPTGPGDTPSRRAIFICHPETAQEETPCARQIMVHLASQAYRRPLKADDPAIDTLMSFYETGRRAGDFQTGIQQALARILVDPNFLYRFEAEPEGLAPGDIYRISGLEMASRLSFFLWSSLPDERLLEVASEGRIFEPAVLEAEVTRMLADPRADALVESFAGQWLQLRELKNVEPQDEDFDANLREAFQRETELFFHEIVRQDHSVIDLLNADYTYVNERLARHYGIEGIRGSYMRRIKLENEDRRGILGQGSFLTVTSVANRTSPVERGVWVVENVLGADVPSPPPGVVIDLDNIQIRGDNKPTTVRERLEMHLVDPSCAACHKLMDPIGFTLENFDLVGRWRETEGGKPIDATTELTDGTQIDGPVSLRQALLRYSDAFLVAFTEKLMTYGLGRTLEPYDEPAVRGILRAAAKEDYSFSSIVRGIVESAPFQMKMKPMPEGQQQAANVE